MEEASEIPEPDVSLQPEAAALISEQRASVIQVADSLTDDQQTALLLKELEGFPYYTIAQVLDSNENAVGALLSRARLKFREVYRMSQARTDGIPDPCVTLLPLLSKDIDREASPDEIRVVQEHLATCPICNGNLESMREASVTYRSLIPMLPLASLKLWGLAKGTLVAGEAMASAAHVAGAAIASTTGTSSVTAAGTATVGTSTVAAPVVTGMSLSTKILTIVVATILAGGVGTAGYLTLKATYFSKALVPSLSGLKNPGAMKKAQDSGFKYSSSQKNPQAARSGNETVVDQSAKPGTWVKKGSTIHVTLMDPLMEQEFRVSKAVGRYYLEGDPNCWVQLNGDGTIQAPWSFFRYSPTIGGGYLISGDKISFYWADSAPPGEDFGVIDVGRGRITDKQGNQWTKKDQI